MPHLPSNPTFGYLPPTVKGSTQATASVEFGLHLGDGLARFDMPRASALDLAAALANVCGFDLLARPSQRRRCVAVKKGAAS